MASPTDSLTLDVHVVPMTDAPPPYRDPATPCTIAFHLNGSARSTVAVLGTLGALQSTIDFYAACIEYASKSTITQPLQVMIHADEAPKEGPTDDWRSWLPEGDQ